MFSKILVAFNGRSQDVIKLVNRLPRTGETTVYVLAVYEPALPEKLKLWWRDAMNADQPWTPPGVDALSKKLDAAVEDVSAMHEKVYRMLHVGDPYHEISRVIHEVRPDLVIVGKSREMEEPSCFSRRRVDVSLAATCRVPLMLARPG